ncbi:MAG: ABC transporter substrate binding protein [Planctomycetota bacterium]|nr:ABC transporter substrate binding protein [Planctomycetota bacterium]
MNSYHAQLPWSAGILRGLADGLGLELLDPQASELRSDDGRLVLKILHMDTKRRKGDEAMAEAVAQARKMIATWRPDLVVTADDNAAKYLVVPHLANGPTPVVFCGVNWDAAGYGLPTASVTGMVEVQLIKQLVDRLRPFAVGNRVAYIKADTLSSRTEVAHFERVLGTTIDKRLVSTFAEWKQAYRAVQDEADLVLVGNLDGLDPGPAEGEAVAAFVHDVTRIPSGSWDSWVAPLVLCTIATKPEEQGAWCAQAATQILSGVSPGSISVVTNHHARVLLNMRLAKQLGVVFPPEIIEDAEFVGQ